MLLPPHQNQLQLRSAKQHDKNNSREKNGKEWNFSKSSNGAAVEQAKNCMRDGEREEREGDGENEDRRSSDDFGLGTL